MVFVGGVQMSPSVVYTLPGTVVPGAVINISIPMTAPGSAGQYRSNWKIVMPPVFSLAWAYRAHRFMPTSKSSRRSRTPRLILSPACARRNGPAARDPALPRH